LRFKCGSGPPCAGQLAGEFILKMHRPTCLKLNRKVLAATGFHHAMLYISAVYAVTRCLSVTFVSCAKTNKDIFEIFPPSGSQAVLVFPYQMGWGYSNGNPPNGGVECKGGIKN